MSQAPDTQLFLGDFEFKSSAEMPEEILLGGAQALSVKKLVGGKRVIDAMGRDDHPIEWSGMFRGPDALARARSLDAMRIAGLPLLLTFFEVRLVVIIDVFEYRAQRFYQVPFHIALVVAEDHAAPTVSDGSPTVDEMMSSDMTDAMSLGDQIADGGLTAALGSLDAAVSLVRTFANAPQSVLAGVLGPIGDVLARIATLIGSVEGKFSSVDSLGGIAPGVLVNNMAATLSAQVGASAQLPVLYDLQNIVGRMANNVVSAAGSGSQIVVAGANLFALAADAYGDGAEWSTISRANGLSDPFISGIRTLLIPRVADGLGGVPTWGLLDTASDDDEAAATPPDPAFAPSPDLRDPRNTWLIAALFEDF